MSYRGITTVAGTSFQISEGFRKRADSAAFYEAWVGAVLARAGLYTVHHPFTLAKGKSELAKYSLTWDLDVSAVPPKGDANCLSVEVKSSSNSFSSTSNYPHPSVLVCSQASFLKKWPGAEHTGRDFLHVSRPTGAILWLPKGTKVTMGIEVFDTSRGESYKAVTAEVKQLCELWQFVEHVHGLNQEVVSSR